jgi:hypothetical protein
MKKQAILALIVAIATSVTVHAQTIALHSATGVQIIKGTTALATAYTAAQSGDTLYLSGGTFTPPSVFDKKLMIFGAGHYVDSTLATGKTFINGILALQDNADMFYIEGVEITSHLTFPTNTSINNVTIKRCKINGTTSIVGDLSKPSNNLALIGNVFIGPISLSNATNVLIANNIIQGGFNPTNGNDLNNNIFLNTNTSYFLYGDNNRLNNNIFLNLWITAGVGNVFNNNLFVSTTPTYGSSPTILNSYTGIAQTAIFVNQTGNAFNYEHNYHLQNPTTYLGTDGTQVGIYGGTFPYKEGAVPTNPHIQVKNIAPKTDANGNLQIQIQVGAQNN